MQVTSSESVLQGNGPGKGPMALPELITSTHMSMETELECCSYSAPAQPFAMYLVWGDLCDKLSSVKVWAYNLNVKMILHRLLSDLLKLVWRSLVIRAHGIVRRC